MSLLLFQKVVSFAVVPRGELPYCKKMADGYVENV
jgi:hypothetical protein